MVDLQYLGTLPGAGEAALAALNTIRGPRGTAVATEPVLETVATEDKAPDMAELLKMMAMIKDTVERLSA